jgi:hypothetical protein
VNRSIFLATLLTCGAVACGDPIKEAQRIEELRVLGARAAVDGDPERATPAAGESVSVEWLLADPSGLPPMTVWSMLACVAESNASGIPFCRDEPLSMALQSDLSDSVPSLTFTVPDADTLGDAKKLTVLAIFCDNGTVELGTDFESTTCRGAGTIQKASFDIPLSNDDQAPNLNPNLSDAALELDGEPWEPEPAVIDCESEDAVRIRADGHEHQVTLRMGEGARETKPEQLDVVELESLQISHLSSLGAFDRRFSGVDSEATKLTIEVPWKAPGELSAAEPAGFYFVVRDDRGGASWLTRALCIDP